MNKIKIYDKEYNCSNIVYLYIKGLESEKRLLKMEVNTKDEEIIKLQKDKDRVVSEREDLLSSCLYQDKIIKKAIEYIHNNQIVFELADRKGIQKWFDKFYKELLDILRGKDGDE